MHKIFSFLILIILIFTACSEPQSKRVKIVKKKDTPTNKMSVEKYDKLGVSEESIKNIKAIPVGTTAPDFTANDQFGNTLELSRLTQKGEVVLIFYRGYWCSFCVKYLATYIEEIKAIEEKGATVIAIAPEGEKYIDRTIESTQLEIPFISDSKHEIMDKYGVTFKVNEKYNQYIEKVKGETLNKINDQWEAYLPVPATYIIGKDGKVKWSHFDPDYKKRASVAEVISNLGE